MIIRDTAENIVAALENLTLPKSNEPLFNPIRFQVGEDGRFKVQVHNNDTKSAFLQAVVKFAKVDGTTDTTLDSAQLLKYLKLYEGKDEIEIDVGGAAVEIRGARKTSRMVPDASNANVPEKLPILKNGVLHYRNGEVPVTTIVDLDAAELNALLADAKLLDETVFRLAFSEKGSVARVGGAEAKQANIETRLNAVVKGSDVSVAIGADFTHLFTTITAGPVQLQLLDGFPLAVIREDSMGKYVYVLSQRKE